MTMMEAIEKAKRLREERARNSPRESAAGTMRSADRAMASRRPEVVLPAPVAPFSCELLHPDPKVLEANRVLMSPNRQHAIASDAYRILRTRLGHRVDSGGWGSVAVTSAGPGEGKSLTVLNLALAVAADKRRNVFLLDLDLRHPSICRYLGVKPSHEIGAYLGGAGEPEDIFYSIGVDNLILAGGVDKHYHSSEMLSGGQLPKLLNYIRSYDANALVLVDLPPLLYTADALAVTPNLSATLLVVAVGKTRRDGLARAVEVLHGVTLAGVVLNYSDESVGGYYG